MMKRIENVKPGTVFRALGQTYVMVRHAGEVDMPRRGAHGTYPAHRVAVRTPEGKVVYVGYPQGAPVEIV